MMENEFYDSIIIGGGIAGSLTALKLLKNNKNKILLLEKGKELLNKKSSSYNGCYKIHSGLHFLKDLKTAKLCLLKGIQFVKEFSPFLLGYGNENQKYLKKSRFYLMSNSAISLNEAIENTNILSQYYEELINKDTSNKVLGESHEFIKILPKDQYQDLISNEIEWLDENDNLIKINVLLCFEYNEYILDFNLFKEYIINQINLSKNIDIVFNYNVNIIRNFENSSYYIVSDQNEIKSKSNQLIGKSIINCSFENIELLDNQIFKYENKINNNCIIRIKCTIVIEIPESMKYISSFLFGIGPYSGFLVNQNNKLVLVSERSSNIAHFNAYEKIPESIQLILDNCTIESNQGKLIANSILCECASYLNEPFRSDILRSKVLELKKGFVKIYQRELYTNKSLYNINSGIHVRNEDLKFKSVNYISNCATKMTYSLDDSNNILKYLNK